MKSSLSDTTTEQCFHSHLWLLKNNQKPSVDLHFLVESSGWKKNPEVCLAETSGHSLPTKSAHGLDSFILLFVLNRTDESMKENDLLGLVCL